MSLFLDMVTQVVEGEEDVLGDMDVCVCVHFTRKY